MAEPFLNKRLFERLRVREGRRQFVLTGDVHDHFMVDLVEGLRSLKDALLSFAIDQGFEVVVFLDDKVALDFARPEMSKLFDEVARLASHDPQAGDRQAHSFVPRARRNAAGTPVAGIASPPAQAAAQDISSNAASAEQTTLDQIGRLLNSKLKSMVVFMNPEKMWVSSPTTADLDKLETVIGWCRLAGGHRESLSVLVVNPNRFEEFTSLADRWGDRSDFTSLVQLPPPDREEIECFLRRVRCRYGLAADVEQLAGVAISRREGLYNFSLRIADFLNENTGATCLDDLFTEGEKTLTTAQLLEDLNKLVGLQDIKKTVLDIVAVAQNQLDRRRLGQKFQPMSYHMFFLGNPGTGKTVVARLIGQVFWSIGLRSSRAFVETSPAGIISAYNPGDTIQNMKNAIGQAMGGVLFIDEVYGLAEDEWGRKALETLMKEMEDNRDNLTVIMAGYEEKMPVLFDVNPGFKSRVNHTLRFPDYSTDELLKIFDLQATGAGLTLTVDARAKLHDYVDSFNRLGGIGNGRGVRNVFEKASKALMASRIQSNEILPEMIPDAICFREAEARELIDRIKADFIGLPRVKRFLDDLFIGQRAEARRPSGDSGRFNHCVFLGNPGTGKTSVARRMGQLFYYMGFVSDRERFVEIDPIHDLTSRYQGEYAKKVRECFDRGVGGVLFIDEAYQLANDANGRAVIHQLPKLVEESRYRNIMVILAGYPDQMQELYKINPGLERRFPHKIHFDDFTPDELVLIFTQLMERDELCLATDEEDTFRIRLRSELLRMSRKRQFGNAGEVRSFYERVKINQERRLMEDVTADAHQLVASDIVREEGSEEEIEAILEEMDREFVGLQSVKEQIRLLARRMKFDRAREAHRRVAVAGENTRLYHMRFTGGPGTGKTTVARYMARVFKSLGITNQPKVRECKGTDLKGSYVGHSKDAVNRLFETSGGHVVLIDEAYGVQGRRTSDVDSFGQEAIDTLNGCILDPHNAGTVVILAGYKDQLDELLRANPGLASRFQAEIEFPDYTADECVQILYRQLDREGYEYPRDSEEFSETAGMLFGTLKQARDFGNARSVGHVFESLKDNLNQRLARMDKPKAQDYFRITLEDLQRLLPQ